MIDEGTSALRERLAQKQVDDQSHQGKQDNDLP